MNEKEEFMIIDKIIIPAFQELQNELKNEYSIMFDEDNLNLNSFKGDNIGDFDFKIKIISNMELGYKFIGGDPSATGIIKIQKPKNTKKEIKKVVMDYYKDAKQKYINSGKTMF